MFSAPGGEAARARRSLALLATFGASLWVEASARAQELVEIEIPALVLDHVPDHATRALDRDDLTQTVLSVAKRVEAVQASSSIITVVPRDAIEVRGYVDLSDLLDDVPGFEGYRPAFYYQSAEAFARGNARTTLVLWNGVPINSPQSNRRSLGPFLPVGAIDRAEVISGPGGVLWGANAFLGVLSVTTQRQPHDRSVGAVTAGLGGGPRGADEYHAAIAVGDSLAGGRIKAYGRLDLVTARGPVVTPPYDLTIGPFPAPDADGTFTLRPSTGATHNARDVWMPLTLSLDVGALRLDVLYPVIDRQFREFNDLGARTDQFVGSDGMLVPGVSSQRAESVTLLSAQIDRHLGASARLSARAYFTGFEDRWIRLVKEPAGLIGPEAIFVDERYAGMSRLLHDGAYRYGVSVDLGHDRGASRLLVGGEVYQEGVREVHRDVSGGLTVGDFVMAHAASRLVTALYADEEIALAERLSVELGVRGQYAPGAYAPLVLGSAAMRWSPYRKMNLKLHAAQGFRPPAFELTNGNDDAVTNPFPHRQSNPELRAERSLSLESEVNARVLTDAGRLRYMMIRVGYQYTRLDDLIVFGPTGEPDNANRRIMSSVELRSDALFTGSHRLMLGYTYLTGEDLETGPLRNIPQHRLNAGVEARLAGPLRAYTGVTVTGAVEDLNRLATGNLDGTATASPGTVSVDRIPSSATVALGVVASGLLGGHLDLAAHVDNALDSRHPVADPDFERREAIYPMAAPGRSARLSITWRM
jgi:outer membrane receptor for ferrienterochelin and colicin